jgi:hypothetical protein
MRPLVGAIYIRKSDGQLFKLEARAIDLGGRMRLWYAQALGDPERNRRWCYEEEFWDIFRRESGVSRQSAPQ